MDTTGSAVWRSSLWLAGAGLISEAIYLLASLRLPWWLYGGKVYRWSDLLGRDRVTFSLCLLAIGLLFAAYGLGWHAIRRLAPSGSRWPRRVVWGCAGLFTVTLFWLLPFNCDLFNYISQAHLFTDLKGNPLLQGPLEAVEGVPRNDSATDSLVQAYATAYAHRPSAYGPAWILASSPGTLGPNDVAGGLAYLKGLAAAAYLGSAGIIERVMRRLRPKSTLEALYLFAWSPLILLMAIGDGHNDMLMMFLVLVGLWLLLQRRWLTAWGALMLSVWVKYVSVVLVPLFACYTWGILRKQAERQQWRVLLLGGLGVMVTTWPVLAPFGSVGWTVDAVARFFSPANWYGVGWVSSGSLTTFIRLALAAGALVCVLTSMVLTRRFIQVFRTAEEGENAGPGPMQYLLDASFLAALLAFLLGAVRSQPWHLIWPVSLAGLSSRRWAAPLSFGLSALMLIGQAWVLWGAPGLGIHA